MIDKETFKLTLTDLLECVNRAVFLQKMGLLETAEIILLENITIGGKNG